jgi:hypothetical protein
MTTLTRPAQRPATDTENRGAPPMNDTETSPPGTWLTRREAATVLGVNWRTVDRYAKPKRDEAGNEIAPAQLTAYRNPVTGHVRFKARDVAALKARRAELRPSTE